MNIIYNNFEEKIKNIIETKAKYQKVMFVYDDNVSNSQISNLYNLIKELCVYNQTHIKDIDNVDVYDGYRVVIYMCDVDSFLKLNIRTSEFINIFYPQSNGYLPFFLSDNNKLTKANDYLLLNFSLFDSSIVASVSFNLFYNYFNNIINFNENIKDISIFDCEITSNNVIDSLQNLNREIEFLDIKILKECNISYKDLLLVDLLMIDAFYVLISSIKNQTVSMVDVYKVGKDDCKVIDRFYKMFNNDCFKNLIILNYNCLYNYCLKCKQKIISCLSLINVANNEIESLIFKLKNYVKEKDDLCGYLYLYNIFNV